MKKIIISLTSIPPRFAGLNQVITSLLSQTVKPDHIILNIPNTYSRFPGEVMPVNLDPIVIINRLSKDYGPASKLLGLQELDLFHKISDDSVIICVDDDRYYHCGMVEMFVRNVAEKRAITIAGWDINTISNNMLSYLYLNMPRGIEYVSPGYIDILGGCCGFALLKNDCPFADKTIFMLNADDPKYYVDDVWISGFLTMNKISIYMIPGYGDAQRLLNDSISPLYDNTRTAKNIFCITYFRDNYNIWN
jgi:hypothetical protein